MEDEADDNSTYGLYDLIPAGRRAKYDDEGSPERMVWVLKATSEGSIVSGSDKAGESACICSSTRIARAGCVCL